MLLLTFRVWSLALKNGDRFRSVRVGSDRPDCNLSKVYKLVAVARVGVVMCNSPPSFALPKPRSVDKSVARGVISLQAVFPSSRRGRDRTGLGSDHIVHTRRGRRAATLWYEKAG